MIVDCAAYTHGVRRPGELELEQAFEAARELHTFVWIGLYQPTADEFRAVATEFELHPLAVEDAIQAHQRPKLEVYDNSIFIVLKTARYIEVDESVEFAEINLFVGEHYLVSVRHGEASALSQVRRAVEARPQILRCGPAAVVHAIVDHVVDDYAPVIAGLDNDIQEVEKQVFSHERVNVAERIYLLKREVLDVHHNTYPLLEPLENVAAGRLPYVSDELVPFFRDVADHLIRVVTRVQDFRDLLSDVLNANLAQVSVRQNDDMRKISAWVAIGAIPTGIGAIYGMNFQHMPELDWWLGYPLSLAIMVALSIYLFRRFKQAGWL